eukprot:9739092-Karenia_brevis.AAC.1
MISGKPTDQTLTSGPDVDAAACTGDPDPTDHELLDSHADEELLLAIPNLDAGRCLLATRKAMAALLLSTCGQCKVDSFSFSNQFVSKL